MPRTQCLEHMTRPVLHLQHLMLGQSKRRAAWQHARLRDASNPLPMLAATCPHRCRLPNAAEFIPGLPALYSSLVSDLLMLLCLWHTRRGARVALAVLQDARWRAGSFYQDKVGPGCFEGQGQWIHPDLGTLSTICPLPLPHPCHRLQPLALSELLTHSARRLADG